MAKKKRRKAAKKKGGRKRWMVSNGGYNILTSIVIKPGNDIQPPDPLVCLPDAPVVWLVDNEDYVEHLVSIDPKYFKKGGKKSGTKGHPFTSDSELTSGWLLPGSRGLMWALVKKNAKTEFYQYPVTSVNSDGTSRTLDPDLDVVDPSSIAQ